MNEDLLIKFIIGLVGVLAGAFLTFLREFWFRKRDKQKELEYLSIRLTCLFDKFISGCFEVIYDDGLFQGQRDEHGYLKAQATCPKIQPDEVDVNWKVLPSDLMYTILSFPEEVELANSVINDCAEYSAEPPDFDDYFEERWFQYAKLGLDAFEIVTKLRSVAKLPDKQYSDSHNHEEMKHLHQKILEIKKAKRKTTTSDTLRT